MPTKEKVKGPKPISIEAACSGCGKKYPSRNQMFKHLKETNGACLDKEEYQEFCKYVRTSGQKQDKVLILYGYLPTPKVIKNGTDAGAILVKAIQEWENQMDGITSSDDEPLKFNRSYGHDQRGLEIVKQDDNTGSITELLSVRIRPLKSDISLDTWLDGVQEILDKQFASSSPVPIRILGRQTMKNSKFNAEMDVSNRRIEYLVPVDFLSSHKEIQAQLENLPSFSAGNQKHNSSSASTEADPRKVRPNDIAKIYLGKLKKIMQKLSTQVIEVDTNDKSAVLEKGFSLQKRKGQTKKHNRKRKKKEEVKFQQNEETLVNLVKTEGSKMLKRKRFHNFTETVMAHEYLAYRRLDRVYHRACLRFSSLKSNKPFLVFSLNGDLFLHGQALRIMGVFLALANELIDSDFIDCVFDEAYPHLIPTPPALPLGMMAGDAHYMMWEGKVKSILSPRDTDRYANGFNQSSTLQRVKEWQDVVYEEIARRWLAQGRDEESGRLIVEKQWTEEVLKPWAEGAREHLQAYRAWVQSKTDASDSKRNDTTSIAPCLSTVDATVPELYQKVLYHLRKIDESGAWPLTTLKRQLVMVSTAKMGNEDSKTESLSIAYTKAKSNKESRSSAYGFSEGQGGASGSFSVGCMPGGVDKQPKSNFLFPELVEAAFELETKLCPSRASSTIAINRNAQFRPHTDSGAGAGQSTSLIVGFGTYGGGELMVEGEKHDIRYNAIEFNGWTQRHWTMPFVGERYSLVWFTPKGCEGMRGIDLELTKE